MNYYEKIIQEKRNSTVEDRFRHKGCMVTILKKSENQYTFTIEQNGHEEGTNRTYSTQDEAERGAKREVEEVWSSKDNSKVLDAEIMSYTDPNTHERYYKVWLVTEEGWRNPRIFKTFQEADREAARIQREVKSQNSKENSMNYYEKIIQEKKNDRYTTLKSIRTERYKGCEINISESKSPYEDRPVYVYSAHDRQMKIFVKGTAGSESEALTKAKREIDIKANSKEEKDNSLVKSEVYKGYTIDIGSMVEKGKIVGYEAHIADKNYKQVGWELWFKSIDEAIRWGKSKIDSGKFNSKEEKDNISDRAIAIAMSYLKDGYKEDKIKKEMMSQYHFSEVQTLSALDYAKKTMHNSKSYYETIIEKKNSLPQFKYCYQAMQWFKEGSQYAEVIDKLVERFHLDKSVAAAAAQKGQQMYEDSYRNK